VLFLFAAWLFQKISLAILGRLWKLFVYIICCGGKSKKQIKIEDMHQKQLDLDAGHSTDSSNILLEYSIGTLEKLYERLGNELEDLREMDLAFFTYADVGCDKEIKARMILRME